jgi:hypothetical protein
MPSPIPPADIPDDDPHEPVSYFTLEQRRLNRETKLGGEPLTTPLPATSPWSAQNVLPDELPIDRTEDAANGGLPDMTEVQQ